MREGEGGEKGKREGEEREKIERRRESFAIASFRPINFPFAFKS